MRSVLRPLPLAIAAMALLGSVKLVGLVHSVAISTPARAETSHAAPAPHAPAPAPARPPNPAPAPVAPAEPPPVSDAERAILQDLRARRAELDARSQAIDAKEAMLAAAERRLNERVEQLTALQTRLEQLEAGRREREEANWRGLVRTYESMRPRDAAAIFNDLETSVLLQVLDRMKEAKAAAILAAMTPERARTVTAQLAELRTRTSAAPGASQ
jgi:flagellar motility protein MotE (MotC chaperone)